MAALRNPDTLILVASHLEPIYKELGHPFLEICSKTSTGFASGYKHYVESYPGFAATAESLAEILILLKAESFFENKMQVGLIHYRRIFSLDPEKDHGIHESMDFKLRYSIACHQAEFLHLYIDRIVIPKPLELESSVLTHFIECVPLLENAIYEACLAFDASVYSLFGVIDSKSELENTRFIYPWNMWIGSVDFYNEWVTLLFPVLKALDEMSNSLPSDGYQSRWSGFIAERIFTIYINLCMRTNRWNFVELPVIFFEDKAITERDKAITERDKAITERDKAISSLDKFLKSKSWNSTRYLRAGDQILRRLLHSPRK